MSKEFSSKTSHINEHTSIDEIIATSKTKTPSLLKYGLKAGMPMGLQYGHSPLPPEEEMDKAWAKVADKYEVLIGSTDNETSLFTQVSPVLKRLARYAFTKKLLVDPLVRYTTGKIYGKAAQHFASNFANAGGTAYVYKIHWGAQSLRLGVAHCVDLALLFGGELWEKARLIHPMPAESLYHHGKQLRAIWAQFARDGSMPNPSQIDPELLTYEKISN